MKLLYLYNILHCILLPIYVLILLYRLLHNKENIKSIIERLGFINKKRPDGKLVWLHAASVGESLLAVTLVEKLGKSYPELNFLFTTTTLSSAHYLKSHLQNNKLHQFLPLDNIFIIRHFLNYWRPDLGIFIESDLWPCLLSYAKKQCPLLLVNARLSDKSFKRWQKWAQLFRLSADNFDRILVQSGKDLEKYKQLGCLQAQNLGNLKFANKILPVNDNDFTILQAAQQKTGKPIFVAASTHLEDELVILSAIKQLIARKIPHYPIIIPRHPERITRIIKFCSESGLNYLQYSCYFPDFTEDVYLVDKLGKSGAFYKLAHITFVGGSFKQGGHNLIEPAHFNNIIIFGPDVSKCTEIADNMLKYGAAIQVQNEEELVKALEFFLNPVNFAKGQELKNNAYNFVRSQQQILSAYLAAIENFIPR